jgi:hypothetical protein
MIYIFFPRFNHFFLDVNEKEVVNQVRKVIREKHQQLRFL